MNRPRHAGVALALAGWLGAVLLAACGRSETFVQRGDREQILADRKSTRLNSSHDV
jgi:hypothetical protein